MDRNFRGYTLVEILVVITISIILFTVGIAGYREFSRRQDLVGVVKKLNSDLRLAQQLALTGQKPTNVGSCAVLIGYYFNLSDSDTYQIVASCSDGYRLTKTVDMPSNVTISATVNPVLFKVLGQGTNLTSDNTITLTNTVSGNVTTVIIGTGGNIQ